MSLQKKINLIIMSVGGLILFVSILLQYIMVKPLFTETVEEETRQDLETVIEALNFEHNKMLDVTKGYAVVYQSGNYSDKTMELYFSNELFADDNLDYDLAIVVDDENKRAYGLKKVKDDITVLSLTEGEQLELETDLSKDPVKSYIQLDGVSYMFTSYPLNHESKVAGNIVGTIKAGSILIGQEVEHVVEDSFAQRILKEPVTVVPLDEGKNSPLNIIDVLLNHEEAKKFDYHNYYYGVDKVDMHNMKSVIPLVDYKGKVFAYLNYSSGRELAVKGSLLGMNVTLLTFGIGLFIVVLLNYIIIYSVVKPIRSLIAKIKEKQLMYNQNRQLAIVNSRSEIKVLNSLFEQYNASIEAYQSDMLHINDMLEVKVKSRTKELEMLHEDLKQMAYYDALTGIGNRSYFYLKLEQNLERIRCGGKGFAIVYMDLDGFKKVNDNYGHDIGDLLLIAFSKRITLNVREKDIFTRMGGDEFTLMLQNIQSKREVEEILSSLTDIVSENYNLKGNDVSVGVSMGYAMAPEDGMESDELIKIADQQMYTVKKANKELEKVFIQGGSYEEYSY